MISYLFQHGGALLLGLVLVLSAVAAWRAHGRGERWVEPALTTASLVGILAITLGRDGMPSQVSVAALAHWAPGGLDRFTLGFGFSEEIWLNIALFLPAGFLLSLRSGRPVRATGGLAMLSCFIEVAQGLLGLGTPDVSDILANTLGAFVGALCGGCALWVLRREADRSLRWGVTGLALAGLAAALLVPVGAAIHQSNELGTLQARFAATKVQDYERWSSSDELGSVFSAGGAFSTGASVANARAVVRYPTSFMGVEQCVLAEWTRSGFGVHSMKGPACRSFMG